MELSAFSGDGAANGSAIDREPVGAGGEKRRVVTGGADGENAGASGFAGASARGGVFDDDALLRWKMQGCGAFEVWLRVRLTVLHVACGHELADEIPKPGGAEADFGERACGGGDHGALRGRDAGKNGMCAGKSDDVGEVFHFTAFHPAIFFQVI